MKFLQRYYERMKILAISQYFPPDITAAAFRIYDLLGWMTSRDHQVTLLTAQPHKAQAKDGQSAMMPNLKIKRSRLSSIGAGGLVRYLAHYFSFVLGTVLYGLGLWIRRRKFDVVWVSSPPLFTGICGWLLSRLFRCSLVLEIRDIWPDTAVAAGQISDAGIGYRMGRKLELMLYKRSDYIVCVSRPMCNYIRSYTDKPVDVIYNGVRRASADLVEKDVGPEGYAGKTIIYAGNIGLLQGLDCLIRAYGELQERGQLDGWTVRLIGAGAEKEKLETLVQDLNLTGRVMIEPPRSRENAFREMLTAHFLFVSLREHPVLARTIPSKIFDCLLTGRPILACLSGEGSEILAETGANLTCVPGDLEALKAILIRAEDEYDELSRNASKNRDLVLERFTRESGAEKLLEIFNRVTSADHKHR